MQIIRATGVASIALAAGLYLVLARGPGDIHEIRSKPAPVAESRVRANSPDRGIPSAVDAPAGDMNREVPAVGARPVFETRLDAGDNPPGDPIPAVEWPLTVYPELASIAEFESQPADRALAGLQSMLRHSDPVVRLAALESLADLGRRAPLSSLTAALADRNPQIRIAALEALTLRRDSMATGSIEALAFDPDTGVRLAAIDALAATGDRSAAHTLGALLGDPDPAVRRGALGALGEIGGDTATGYLRQSRYAADASVRASATAILRERAPGSGQRKPRD